jgi:uncharacterized membrane protein YbhN (UPF0104 family)
MKKNIFKALFAALLLLCGFFFAITHFGELTRFLLLLGNLDPFWIAAALVFQLATYFSLALVWQRALFFNKVIYPLRKLVPLAIAKLFADQALPSGGISGIAFIVSAFTQQNVSGQVATGVMLLSILSYYGAYVLAAASAILVLWIYHDIHQWIITVSSLFFLIAIAIPAGILFLKQWRAIPGWLVRMPHISGILEVYANAPGRILRNPRLLFEATLFQIAIFMLDTATLWAMLHALGEDASLLLAFPCFIIASIVAMLSLIPLGIGAFEVTCAGLLVMLGIRVESAFAATLLLRGFTLWLPMIPGLWLTRRMFL